MKEEVYKLLSKQFKTAQEVMTEIINLQAILNLPKGTEHFLSDLHGEADAFRHLLRIASGVIKTKIDLAFGPKLTLAQKNDLAALIYEPKTWLEERKKSSKNLKKEYKKKYLTKARKTKCFTKHICTAEFSSRPSVKGKRKTESIRPSCIC